MPQYDLPLAELQTYRPARTEPADFDAFWQDTLATARNHPLNARFEPGDWHLHTLEVFDVTFSGYAGQPVKGWLLLPRGRTGKLPCIVEYIGYGGGRGYPYNWLLWASAGFAHFVMDTRGQGSVWLHGDTPDPEPDGGNSQAPGFITARRSALMKLSVSGVAGSSRSTKSDSASTSDARSAGTTLTTFGTGSGRRRAPMTRMPRTDAIRATCWPIAPSPRMPSVLPVRGCATVRTHVPRFWFATAAA